LKGKSEGGRNLHVRILRRVACPLSQDPVDVEECMKCEFHRGIEGFHVLDPDVKCAASDSKVRVELWVFCPMVQHMLEFRKCLICFNMRGFYGFHDGNPIVDCAYG
jgi:hypothetical protein